MGQVSQFDKIATDLAAYKSQNKKIVFTNGCFDLLHVGHVRYLQEARKLGDILVIGVNSDASVKRLKGPTRPVQIEADRAEILAALGCVDFTVIFTEDTPEKLIKAVKPDILVKGGDWKIEQIVGSDFVIANGGKVMSLQFVDGKSTTKLIEKAQK
ncbi:D-glycero-beta-D-manno-heptose 1-phosphate adenylyltransferase [Bdellovibrio sp. HCB337]|uniref:D-glycero-beta-D-manno-heptose 1-phosphate adenylyltransferase n=1 Tax=Bdellovibrio sp. HCB337 TaxID=3394358 RepID=UPI0039A65BE2